jgi:hypothetical protein
MSTWGRFHELCTLRFGTAMHDTRLSELARLPFISTVHDYVERFNAVLCHAHNHLKGKCALGPFLSVLVIKCLTHHFDLTYNSEYKLRVKEKQIESCKDKLQTLQYWRNKCMILALSKLFLVLTMFY